MPTNYRTLNQTRINSSGSEWITTTPTQATTAWAGIPSVTTSSSATRVYIDASAPSFVYAYDGLKEKLESGFFRPRIEIPRELTDEELVKVLNS